jgi:ABC-type multidrug transport system permease subunit
VFPIWNVQVQCTEEEYGVFDPPAGQTCGAYMQDFLTAQTGYLNNPVCPSFFSLSGEAALIRVAYRMQWRIVSTVSTVREASIWRVGI